MSLTILYASIALLLTVLVFIRGMIEARTRTAIERLSVKISELTERSANTTLSEDSRSAGDAEIIGAIDQLNAKIVQLAELLGARMQDGRQITICADVRTSIEQLTGKIEQLTTPAVDPSEDASHDCVLEETKAAIDVLTMTVQQLTAGIQEIGKPTAELEKWRSGMQRELRDVLKEFR